MHNRLPLGAGDWQGQQLAHFLIGPHSEAPLTAGGGLCVCHMRSYP